MGSAFDLELEEWLVRCARIDTQSDPDSGTTPSTAIQLDLSRLLVDELTRMGAEDVALTDYGAVLATVPATAEGDGPTVAFLAHVDTAPAFNATGVKPIVTGARTPSASSARSDSMSGRYVSIAASVIQSLPCGQRPWFRTYGRWLCSVKTKSMSVRYAVAVTLSARR